MLGYTITAGDTLQLSDGTCYQYIDTNQWPTHMDVDLTNNPGSGLWHSGFAAGTGGCGAVIPPTRGFLANYQSTSCTFCPAVGTTTTLTTIGPITTTTTTCYNCCTTTTTGEPCMVCGIESCCDPTIQYNAIGNLLTLLNTLQCDPTYAFQIPNLLVNSSVIQNECWKPVCEPFGLGVANMVETYSYLTSNGLLNSSGCAGLSAVLANTGYPCCVTTTTVPPTTTTTTEWYECITPAQLVPGIDASPGCGSGTSAIIPAGVNMGNTAIENRALFVDLVNSSFGPTTAYQLYYFINPTGIPISAAYVCNNLGTLYGGAGIHESVQWIQGASTNTIFFIPPSPTWDMVILFLNLIASGNGFPQDFINTDTWSQTQTKIDNKVPGDSLDPVALPCSCFVSCYCIPCNTPGTYPCIYNDFVLCDTAANPPPGIPCCQPQTTTTTTSPTTTTTTTLSVGIELCCYPYDQYIVPNGSIFYLMIQFLSIGSAHVFLVTLPNGSAVEVCARIINTPSPINVITAGLILLSPSSDMDCYNWSLDLDINSGYGNVNFEDGCCPATTTTTTICDELGLEWCCPPYPQYMVIIGSPLHTIISNPSWTPGQTVLALEVSLPNGTVITGCFKIIDRACPPLPVLTGGWSTPQLPPADWSTGQANCVTCYNWLAQAPWFLNCATTTTTTIWYECVTPGPEPPPGPTCSNLPQLPAGPGWNVNTASEYLVDERIAGNIALGTPLNSHYWESGTPATGNQCPTPGGGRYSQANVIKAIPGNIVYNTAAFYFTWQAWIDYLNSVTPALYTYTMTRAQVLAWMQAYSHNNTEGWAYQGSLCMCWPLPCYCVPCYTPGIPPCIYNNFTACDTAANPPGGGPCCEPASTTTSTTVPPTTTTTTGGALGVEECCSPFTQYVATGTLLLYLQNYNIGDAYWGTLSGPSTATPWMCFKIISNPVGLILDTGSAYGPEDNCVDIDTFVINDLGLAGCCPTTTTTTYPPTTTTTTALCEACELVLLVDSSSPPQIYNYNHTTNQTNLLFTATQNLGYSSDIAIGDNKIWVYTNILMQEYAIDPVTCVVTWIREIILPAEVGNGLCYYGPGTLIGGSGWAGTPQAGDVCYIDITSNNAIISSIVSPTAGDYVEGDIIYLPGSNTFIASFYGPAGSRVGWYDLSTGNWLNVTTPPGPHIWGLYCYNNNIYGTIATTKDIVPITMSFGVITVGSTLQTIPNPPSHVWGAASDPDCCIQITTTTTTIVQLGIALCCDPTTTYIASGSLLVYISGIPIGEAFAAWFVIGVGVDVALCVKVINNASGPIMSNFSSICNPRAGCDTLNTHLINYSPPGHGVVALENGCCPPTTTTTTGPPVVSTKWIRACCPSVDGGSYYPEYAAIPLSNLDSILNGTLVGIVLEFTITPQGGVAQPSQCYRVTSAPTQPYSLADGYTTLMSSFTTCNNCNGALPVPPHSCVF